MRKINLLLLLLCHFSLASIAQPGQTQQIKIVNFTVKNQLPAIIDNWNNMPGSLLLVAQKSPATREFKGVKLLLQIKSGGSLICGSNYSNGLPVDDFTTRSFNVNELTGLLSACHELKDGSYTICAQFFSVERVAISNEVCKEFTMETAKETEFSPPTLITPENGKEYSSTDMIKPVMFRWTPLVPKPKEPVTYRMKVWQLMQGQNATTAMRTNQPIVTKDVDNITQAVVSNIYTGPCRPPYLCDYVWNVQAVNREGKPMGRNNGTSEPYTFKVVDKSANEASPPKLVAPVDGKKFLPKDMTAPTLFRWTPVVPKPQEPVTYRLKVWQLMQGQSGSQAMRSNKPIVEKEMLITEVTVPGIYTGPCRPPYLCDYVWQVQAVNREGQPVGGNEGKSEVWSFKVQNNIDTEIDSVFVSCCEKNVQNIYIRVKNNLANPVNIVSIKYKINGAGASIILTPVTPAVPTATIAGNGSQVFTATVKCITANFLKFLVDAEDVADPDNKETEVVYDTLKCICNACDSIKIDVVQKDIKFDANGNINMNTNISVTPKLVKNIKAELVYFDYKPDSDDCMLCNKDSKTFGNFGNGTHSQEWNFSPPKNLSGGTPAAITITVPPTVKCCDAVIRWCIRYVVTFDDCTVCNKLICYEKKKEGCAKGNINPNNDQK